MAADRFSFTLVSLCLSAAAAAVPANPAADPAPPFSVQDLVRLERISEVAVAPDGKRVAYTLRSTDMEDNKGRTGIWMVDVGNRGAAAQRLTDIAANSSAAEWSADGR